MVYFQFGADGGAKWRVRKPERARDEIGMRARPARRRPENEGPVTRRIKRLRAARILQQFLPEYPE